MQAQQPSHIQLYRIEQQPYFNKSSHRARYPKQQISTNVYPSIGIVTSLIDGIYSTTIGCIISPTFIITNASACLHHKNKKQCQKLTFTIYPTDQTKRQEIQIVKFYVPDQYRFNYSQLCYQYNYALLEVNENVNLERCGVVGYDFQGFINHNQKAEIVVFTIVTSSNGQIIIQQQSFPPALTDKHYIFYQNYSLVESPANLVFIRHKMSFQLVGTIQFVEGGDIRNKGVRISMQMLENMRKWIRKSINIIKFSSLNQLNQANLAQVQSKLINYFDAKQIGLNYNSYQQISHINSTQLLHLDISLNQISTNGCHWLATAQWPQLQTINLEACSIDAAGCKQLISAYWKQLNTIHLGRNNLGIKGCFWLSKSKWDNLQEIYLWANNIQNQGCRWLSKANWPFLNKLDLQANQLFSEDCQWLVRGNWPYLKILNLGGNNIDDAGVLALGKANWPNLYILDLWKNQFSRQTYHRQYLLAKYQNIAQLYL